MVRVHNIRDVIGQQVMLLAPSPAVTCARPCLSSVSHQASVGAVSILWPFQLHLQPLHANLEAVHSLDGSLGTSRIVKTHKACQNTRQGTGFNWLQGGSGTTPHTRSLQEWTWRVGKGTGREWSGRMLPSAGGPSWWGGRIEGMDGLNSLDCRWI